MENIAFKVTVDTDVADLSVGELKQAFKDLTKEINSTQVGTDKYKQTLTKLGDVKGALKDVKEQINALDPEKKFRAIAQVGSSIASGFAAAQGAVALFGSESEDLQKVLVRVQAATALASGLQGLQGMGKAFQTLSVVMKANPIWTIAAVLTGIGAALFALRDKIKIVGDAFNALGKAFDWIVGKAKEMLDSVGLYDLAADRAVKANERIKKSLKDLTDGNNNYIKLLKAQGKETYQIEKDTLESRLELISQQIANRKALTNEEHEELKKLQTELYIELQQLNTDHNKKIAEQNKEREKELEKIRKRIREKINEEGVEDEKIRYDEIVNTYNTNKAFREQAEADEEAARLKRLENEKTVADFRVMVQSETFKTIGELALAFAGKSEASQRRAFQINKAAGIAQTTVDTFVGAQKAYASQLIVGDPSSPVRAAIAAGFSIAQGLARVAIIAKTQFESKSATGGGGSVSAPNLQSPQTANNNSVSISERGVNEDKNGNFAGFQQPIKAYVVETEMTSKQKTIQSIEQRTTF